MGIWMQLLCHCSFKDDSYVASTAFPAIFNIILYVFPLFLLKQGRLIVHIAIRFAAIIEVSSLPIMHTEPWTQIYPDVMSAAYPFLPGRRKSPPSALCAQKLRHIVVESGHCIFPRAKSFEFDVEFPFLGWCSCGGIGGWRSRWI